MTLPPFPVDDQTLESLSAAINPWAHGDETAERSCVSDFLRLMSEMGGSDTEAVEAVLDPGDTLLDGIAGAPIHMMRDPQYTEFDVMTALIAEVRRPARFGTEGAPAMTDLPNIPPDELSDVRSHIEALRVAPGSFMELRGLALQLLADLDVAYDRLDVAYQRLDQCAPHRHDLIECACELTAAPPGPPG